MVRTTHVTVELAPDRVVGGLGIATSRLIAQLERAGARSRVLTSASEHREAPPSWGERVDLPTLGFVEHALEALARDPPADDELLVVHESAALLPLVRARGIPGRRVQWVHSLYDTPLPHELPAACQLVVDPDSALASAIDAADLVVTSMGILADASEVAWSGMHVVQAALLRAAARGATRTVEAHQCLPPPIGLASPMPDALARPRVLFPSRSGVHKGIGVFLAIVEALADLDLEFFAIGDPTRAGIDPSRPGAARVRWLPWLAPAELDALMASASCVVVPSLSEGFGLTAAEAAARGLPVVIHDIGGLRSLPASAATIVALTLAERARLYALWGELRRSRSAWACWDAALPDLAGLVARWTECVEAKVRASPIAPTPRSLGPADAPNWGQALLEWA